MNLQLWHKTHTYEVVHFKGFPFQRTISAFRKNINNVSIYTQIAKETSILEQHCYFVSGPYRNTNPHRRSAKRSWIEFQFQNVEFLTGNIRISIAMAKISACTCGTLRTK